MILLIDETWVADGRYIRVLVARRFGEELNTTCTVEKRRAKPGWMFWGCFNGKVKGARLFWEKG